MTSNRVSKLTRRWFVKGLGGTVLVAGSGAGSSTVLANQDDTDDAADDDAADDEAVDAADATDADVDYAAQLNRVLVVDTDFGMQFDQHMQLDGDPAEGDRRGVVHVTSDGRETQDFVGTTIDLRDEGLLLEDVSEPGSLTYDYYAGADHGHAIPDEVALVLRAEDGVSVAHRSLDDEGADEWQTRDVSEELSADDWRAFSVSSEELDLEGEQSLAITRALHQRVGQAVEPETFGDVVDRFGEDAEVLAVGIGVGEHAEPVVTDAYYHDVQVLGQSKSIPAMIGMTPEFERADDTVQVTLSFADSADEPADVALEDVDGDTVTMSRYAPVAPPVVLTDVQQDAVTASDVTATDDGLEAHFDLDEVSQLVEDGVSERVMVYGAFEHEDLTVEDAADDEDAGEADVEDAGDDDDGDGDDQLVTFLAVDDLD